VIDLAVGIIIGAAFTSIVNSLVNDIIMPIIGVIIGRIDLTKLQLFGLIKYGNFLQQLVNFLIIAWVVFLLVRGINRFRRQEAETPAQPPAPTDEEKLLGEIRDLLKAQAQR
jgi:large conductance mechanosensitive channel